MKAFVFPVLALGFTVLPHTAQADSHPWRFEVGGYAPAEGKTRVGTTLALGVDLVRNSPLQFGIEARTTFCHVPKADEDVTILQLSAQATYRAPGTRFFYGVGLGSGSAVNLAGSGAGSGLSDDETAMVYSLHAGLELSPQAYLVARYQGSGSSLLRGYSLGLGWRF